MFTKANVKKVRSLFSGVALTGLATAALFLGATGTVNAQTDAETTAPTATRGGTTNKFLDFTGNGTTDFVTLDFTTGGPISWRVLGNPASAVPNQALIRRFDYGLTGNTADDGDSIAVGDYTGDSKTDLVVWRNTVASGPTNFYVAQFPLTAAAPTLERTVQWGNGFTDSVAPGDYDGDGKVDYTVVRAVGTQASNTLVWYILSSSTNTTKIIYFGNIPAAGSSLGGTVLFNGADFNADGRDELIIVRSNASGSLNSYFIGDSNTGALLNSTLFGSTTFTFGNYNTDYSLTPADYTGDGRADFVAVRQTDASGSSIWYVRNSATGAVTGTRFGIADPSFGQNGPVGDLPVRGDYDGDNRHDIAVWRQSTQTFYYISSIFNNIQVQPFGDAEDFPLGSFGQY